MLHHEGEKRKDPRMTSIWGQIQHILQNTLAPGLFKVWISPLAGEVDGSTLRVEAPNEFVAGWVRDRLFEDIRTAACGVIGDTVEVVVTAGAPATAAPRPVLAPRPAVVEVVPTAAPVPSVVPAVEARPSGHAPRRLSAETQQAQEQLGLPLDWAPVPQSRTNWRFSFDDFIVGPNNELACAAARGMCRDGLMTDTLFLSSGPGLGKTHLLHAVGRSLCESSNRSNPNVAYLTAEEFASRLIAALKARDVERFKARYRDVDVLLLEDVHFLQGKEKMQDEVLATVKALQSRGSRIVFSSSFAARDLKNVDNQLVSRFCSGFLAGIERPDFDTRRRILREKARIYQGMLPDNVTDLLAERISTDVRQIESCLHNLILKAKLLNRQISLEMAFEIIGNYAQAETQLDFEGIVRMVCEGFGLSPEQLNSRSRKREYVVARNAAYLLARKHTDLSLKEIGDRFNRRHSTVLKGITALEREMNRETPLGRQVANTISLLERNGRITHARH